MNVQTSVQLCSLHMLANQCSQSFKLGFNSMWTVNFQMFKLDLEKAEEPETKLTTSIGSSEKQESSRKTSTSALLTISNPLIVEALKNWCFQTMVLVKTLNSPLNWREIKPVSPTGNQHWIFIGRTDADAEAEAPILWPPDEKSPLIRKDPLSGKDWRQEEKGTTEDEMVGWHHQLNGYVFEQAPGDGEGQGSLVFCNPWSCKELDRT